MAIKRTWEDDREVENLSKANCLMLLYRVGQSGHSQSPGQVFHCKTCNKGFKSFQALGGHQASHKRPKLTGRPEEAPSLAKAKTHECCVCGLEFAIGQALGGHMRRHRDSITGKGGRPEVVPAPATQKVNRGKRGLCLDLNLTPYE